MKTIKEIEIEIAKMDAEIEEMKIINTKMNKELDNEVGPTGRRIVCIIAFILSIGTILFVPFVILSLSSLLIFVIYKLAMMV